MKTLTKIIERLLLYVEYWNLLRFKANNGGQLTERDWARYHRLRIKLGL